MVIFFVMNLTAAKSVIIHNPCAEGVEFSHVAKTTNLRGVQYLLPFISTQLLKALVMANES